MSTRSTERRNRRRVVRRGTDGVGDKELDCLSSLLSTGQVGSSGNEHRVRAIGEDADREVIIDPEDEEPLSDEEFWREQIPPHWGK